jgi:hypothetical protein
MAVEPCFSECKSGSRASTSAMDAEVPTVATAIREVTVHILATVRDNPIVNILLGNSNYYNYNLFNLI